MQRIYQIPDEDKAKVLADLYPFVGAPSIDDTLFDLSGGAGETNSSVPVRSKALYQRSICPPDQMPFASMAL